MTTVAVDLAKATSVDNFLAEVVPVITQKLSEIPLLSMKFLEKRNCNRDEIPGTTNVGIPKLSTNSISSLPLPKINGISSF
jgi:hypothetical protein